MLSLFQWKLTKNVKNDITENLDECFSFLKFVEYDIMPGSGQIPSLGFWTDCKLCGSLLKCSDINHYPRQWVYTHVTLHKLIVISFFCLPIKTLTIWSPERCKKYWTCFHSYFLKPWFSSDAGELLQIWKDLGACNKRQAPVHSSSYKGLLCVIARAQVVKRAGDLMAPEAQAINLCQACVSVAHEYHKTFKMWQLNWFTCNNSYLNTFLMLRYFAPAVWSQGELY